jgi:outer membrane protein OmpA-like peptidoglycan-associated protein
VKLSQARAQSVIAALVSKHGIAASRLIAFGNGPYAPVATNETDEGRAKNRRVELVKIATK